MSPHLLRALRPVLWFVAMAPHVLDRRWPAFLGRRTWLRGRDAALAAFPRRFSTVVGPERIVHEGSTRDVIHRAIYLYGVWEPDITAWVRGFLRPGDTAIDIGANTGYYALLFSRLVGPTGRVHAFEPVPSIHAELCANLVRNAADNVVRTTAAVGAEPGQIEVFRAEAGNVGNSSTRWEPGHSSEGTSPVVVADEALREVAGSVRLVKIDTEGDEIRVLRGMSETLAAMPAGSAVLVEVTPDKLALRGDDGAEVWQLFSGLGWRSHVVRNDYDFTAYAGSHGSALQPVDRLPPERCDMVFVKR